MFISILKTLPFVLVPRDMLCLLDLCGYHKNGNSHCIPPSLSILPIALLCEGTSPHTVHRSTAELTQSYWCDTDGFIKTGALNFSSGWASPPGSLPSGLWKACLNTLDRVFYREPTQPSNERAVLFPVCNLPSPQLTAYRELTRVNTD